MYVCLISFRKQLLYGNIGNTVNSLVFFQENDKILQKLQSKEMQISNVESAYIEKYSKALAEAKAAKMEAALNKVFDYMFA